ncbi:MAG: DivIVA domain-containing protein [Actinomycetia bacterium]|nr:DivIVA domain-containing protein [Actinomycetes bacterium]
MADEVTSGEIRTRQFDVVRKGYDRTQVEAFLAATARRIEELERDLAGVSAAALAIGIDSPEALARELSTIGGDVGNILEAARATAEGMRVRATTDATEWTTTARSDASQTVSDAGEQAHSMRAAAWNEGSSMLQSAVAVAQQVIGDAKEEALFIRAEAEREAIRHTGDAKRDREETVRSAKLEGEQIIENARFESDGMLAAANQAAELAQERARALEDRRSELLAELEAAKSSIGQLESEIETKRQTLEEPAEPEVLDDSVAGKSRTHHATDGGSVRIVSSSKAVNLTPVDPDSFVAEVVALREQTAEISQQEADIRRAREEANRRQMAEEAVSYQAREEADSRQTAEEAVSHQPSAVSEEEAISAEGQATEETDHSGAIDPIVVVGSALESETAVTIEPEPEPEPEAETEPEPAAGADERDAIGSLFAQLRTERKVQFSPTKEVHGSQAEEVHSSQSTVDSKKEAVSRQPSVASEEVVSEDEGVDGGVDDVAVSLIPMQNAALREIKRSLVDLQNDTLEHLRTDSSWTPEEDFTEVFVASFAGLALAIGGDGDDVGAASVFATDLFDALESVITDARAAGSGDRAVAAAASKVFRTWRSDEAERRVVAAAEAFAKAPSDV